MTDKSLMIHNDIIIAAIIICLVAVLCIQLCFV